MSSNPLEYFLTKLTKLAKLKHALKELPSGYSLRGTKRLSSEHVDFYLFGHPSGRSPKEFLPHFISIKTYTSDKNIPPDFCNPILPAKLTETRKHPKNDIYPARRTEKRPVQEIYIDLTCDSDKESDTFKNHSVQIVSDCKTFSEPSPEIVPKEKYSIQSPSPEPEIYIDIPPDDEEDEIRRAFLESVMRDVSISPLFSDSTDTNNFNFQESCHDDNLIPAKKRVKSQNKNWKLGANKRPKKNSTDANTKNKPDVIKDEVPLRIDSSVAMFEFLKSMDLTPLFQFSKYDIVWVKLNVRISKLTNLSRRNFSYLGSEFFDFSGLSPNFLYWPCLVLDSILVASPDQDDTGVQNSIEYLNASASELFDEEDKAIFQYLLSNRSYSLNEVGKKFYRIQLFKYHELENTPASFLVQENILIPFSDFLLRPEVVGTLSLSNDLTEYTQSKVLNIYIRALKSCLNNCHCSIKVFGLKNKEEMEIMEVKIPKLDTKTYAKLQDWSWSSFQFGSDFISLGDLVRCLEPVCVLDSSCGGGHLSDLKIDQGFMEPMNLETVIIEVLRIHWKEDVTMYILGAVCCIDEKSRRVRRSFFQQESAFPKLAIVKVPVEGVLGKLNMANPVSTGICHYYKKPEIPNIFEIGCSHWPI